MDQVSYLGKLYAYGLNPMARQGFCATDFKITILDIAAHSVAQLK